MPAVIGDRAAADTEDTRRVGAVHGGSTADHFIDHPTQSWLEAHLPSQLIETAYQLPSDCADIAVILRHVWLSAHNRTETFRQWTIGDLHGGSDQAHIAQVIGQVYSGNVAEMVAPYLRADGRPERSHAALAALIHPGDILVWEHHDAQGHRTGGHTQTIAAVNPDGSLVALQGNQPLDKDDATSIAGQVGTAAPAVAELRQAQARRIEIVDTSELSDGQLTHTGGVPESVWRWNDGPTVTTSTTLVVAGPPLSSSASHHRGVHLDRLTDWSAALRGSISPQARQGIFEMALRELRAALESRHTPTAAQATTLGTLVGASVWRSARESIQAQGSRDLADVSHGRAIQDLESTMDDTFRHLTSADQTTARPLFSALREAMFRAARGIDSIDFSRGASGRAPKHRVLVTGFDPFVGDTHRLEWNPSGVAALALDGQTLSSSATGAIAVEGVVLPVQFSRFDENMLESIVRPLAHVVDAVITISEFPGAPPGGPLRLERFVVATRRNDDGQLIRVPGGPLVLDNSAVVDAVAARSQHALPVSTGTSVQLGFADRSQAGSVLAVLGSHAVPHDAPATTGRAPGGEPIRQIADVDQPAALLALRHMSANGVVISVPVGSIRIPVTVVQGPGGNYMSNEISFRTLSTLAAEHSDALSFHIHTPGGQGGTPRDGSRLPAATAQTRSNLIAGVKQLIIATVAETATRSHP